MILTPEQIAEFEVVAKPLMAWMYKNLRHHTKAIVDSKRAELTEGVCSIMRKEK